MNTQFWVIGGEFKDTRFDCVTGSPATALGPFASYDEALGVWREVSVASRPQAHVRYTIASNTSH
jgi:hypothetical protein